MDRSPRDLKLNDYILGNWSRAWQWIWVSP